MRRARALPWQWFKQKEKIMEYSEEAIGHEKFINYHASQPTIHKHVDGGFVWSECIECGVDVSVDEDGCCSCGLDALRYGKEGGNEN